MPIQKILVPTDFSTYSDLALDEALTIGSAFSASITLLHAYQLPLPLTDSAYANATDEHIRAVEAAAQTELARARAGALRRWSRPESELSTKFVIGPPALRIIEEAGEGGYDLIVLGTHGRTGLKHLFLGSVAERVVRTATCPVLTVPGRLGVHLPHDRPADPAPAAGPGARVARPATK